MKKQTFGYGARNVCFALAAIFALAFVGCGDAEGGATGGGHVHDYTWQVTTPATCVEKGVETGVCKSDSSHTTTREIPIDTVNGHDWGKWEGTVTCTTAGTGTRVCSRSETHTETDNNMQPLGHAYNDEDWEVTEAPTCSEVGKEEANCVRYAECGNTGTRELPIDTVNGHNWELSPSATAPTCTVNGNGDQICTINQEHIKTGVIPALGHDWDYDNADVTTAATCKIAGSQTVACKRDGCNVTEVQTIPIDLVNGHDYQWVSTATETEDGEEEKVCTYEQLHRQEGSTRIAYALGTEGLSFTAIGSPATAYRVARGTATGAIAIPAYHRLNPDSDYLPVQIPDSTTTSAFGGNNTTPNTTVTSITFTEGSQIATIGQAAFFRCTSLTSITIPASVTTIGYNAFAGCTGLTSITIPEGVTSVYLDAFTGCTNLTDIIIDTDKVTNEATTNWGTKFPASNLSVTFKKDIGAYAFNNCTRLTSVTISEGVTTILGAFNGCSNLTNVIIDNDTVTTTTSTNWRNRFPNAKNVTFKKNVPDYAFYGTSSNSANLTSLTIEAGVASIGERAFMYCSGLTDIPLPASLTTIGNGAFMYCSGFTSITLPASLTTIGDSTFYGCTGLISITIPASVTTIGSSAFSGCSGLTSVTIPAGVTTIGQRAFEDCIGLTSIEIPGSVTSINDYTFDDCANLANVTISEGVTSIGKYAFNRCTELRSIIIPASVKSIGDSAFSYTNLNNVTFSGPIASDSFSTATPFPGAGGANALRAKFYETDPANGTPGTYIMGSYQAWALQP